MSSWKCAYVCVCALEDGLPEKESLSKDCQANICQSSIVKYLQGTRRKSDKPADMRYDDLS